MDYGIVLFLQYCKSLIWKRVGHLIETFLADVDTISNVQIVLKISWESLNTVVYLRACYSSARREIYTLSSLRVDN